MPDQIPRNLKGYVQVPMTPDDIEFIANVLTQEGIELNQWEAKKELSKRCLDTANALRSWLPDNS